MSAITPPFAVVGDPDAERPLLLIDAPDLRGRTWGAIPTELELVFQPTLKYGHQADALGGQLTESAQVAYPGRRRSEPGEGPAGALVIAETRRGLRSIIDHQVAHAYAPTLIVVHGLEPVLVAAAIENAPEYVPPTHQLTVPLSDWSFVDAIVESELARGNRDLRVDGDRGDPRSSLQLRYPLDADALDAEFEFDPGIEWIVRGRVPFLEFAPVGGSGDGWSGWGIGGARRFPSIESIAARELWWEDWRRNPRPKRRVTNPFRPAS